MKTDLMRFRVFLPEGVFLDREAAKIQVQGRAGRFCLLPRHADLATSLAPGILSWTAPDGKENFAALDGGIMVKAGYEVMAASRRGLAGELGELKIQVRAMLEEAEETERQTRTATARLEAGFVRGLMEISRGE